MTANVPAIILGIKNLPPVAVTSGTLLLETIRASDCGRPNQRSPKTGSTQCRHVTKYIYFDTLLE